MGVGAPIGHVDVEILRERERVHTRMREEKREDAAFE